MDENTEITEKKQNPPNQFQPGVSGNPAGRPKGSRSFTTKVREALEKIADGKDYTYEEAFIKSILKKAIVDGDSTIQRLIWNYLDGMPIQKLAGDPNNPLIIQISKEVADKNNIDESTPDTEYNSEGQEPVQSS